MAEQKRLRNMRRHIPAELVEQMLLNLPVKSLLRFSTVSKSWKSTILGGEFARRYRGREMLALKLYSSGAAAKYVVCPISDMDKAAPLPLPSDDADFYTEVSCGALRCVAAGNTLRLYNPSTRAHRSLPAPRCPPRLGSPIFRGSTTSSVHVLGLGYDAAGDEYKVVKSHVELYGETEVYSLKSDCWRIVRDSKRKIQLCFSGRNIRFLTRKGAFVSGALHWLVLHGSGHDLGHGILSFDVAEESYGAVAMPALPGSFRVSSYDAPDVLDVCVLRGRLAVCVNYRKTLVVWVREVDGIWSKDLAVDYHSIQPLCYSYLKPFYFCDAHGSVVKAVTTCADIRKLFIYREEEDGSSSLVEESFGSKGYGVIASFTYFETLVSPFLS